MEVSEEALRDEQTQTQQASSKPWSQTGHGQQEEPPVPGGTHISSSSYLAGNHEITSTDARGPPQRPPLPLTEFSSSSWSTSRCWASWRFSFTSMASLIKSRSMDTPLALLTNGCLARKLKTVYMTPVPKHCLAHSRHLTILVESISESNLSLYALDYS